MLKLFTKKRWLTTNKAVKMFRPYDVVDLGITWINPKDIIGLLFPVKEIKNDEKIQRLRQLVNSNGWDDKTPSDLHLYFLPNGKFTVATGGNHRSYLSNELNIPKIKAYVTILLPINSIPEVVKSKVEYFWLKESIYEKEATEINKYLQEKGFRRNKYEHETKLYENYCDLADKMHSKRAETLLSLARDLNLIPKEVVAD